MVLYIYLIDIKNKNNNYSTAVHDVIMINKNLLNINNVNNESKYFYLLGDKAYKTQEKLKLDNKIVKIVTPDKKNAKNKNKKP